MQKKLVYFFPLAIAAMFFVCPTMITSCTKTNTITKTDTLIKTDTLNIPEKDTIVTPAILTANPWEAIYDRASVGGNILFYERGASGNTMDLDNESITFNANGTGIYTDNSGTQTTLTWSYPDSSYTTLVWIWNQTPQPVTVTWENLSYHDGAIHYTEFYDRSGIWTLGDEIRIPK